MKFIYDGFIYATLAEAEAARKADGGILDGRRKVIWGPGGEAL